MLKAPADVIRFVRNQMAVQDISQVSDDTIIDYTNIAYDRVINIINQNISDEYYANIFRTNFIAGRNVYAIPTQTATLPGLNRVNGVAVNYNLNSEERWVRATAKEFVGNEYDFAELEKRTMNESPIYILYDKTINIFPSPKTSVANGIKLYGSIDALPVTADGTVGFVVERNWILLIAKDVMCMVLQGRLKIEEKQAMIKEYEMLKDELITNYNERDKSPVIRDLSSITGYPYIFK